MTRVIAPGHEVVRDLKTNRVKWLIRAVNNDMDRLVRVSRFYDVRGEQMAKRLRSRIAVNQEYINRMVCAEGA